MTNAMEVYKCNHCGIIAQILHSGASKMICCGEPMQLLVANTTDAAKEKHVPVVEIVDGGIKVSVGSVPHPMEEMHYIEWVEVIVGDKTCRKFFKPGEAPSVTFKCGDASDIIVRAYCNLHGLWKA